MTLLPIIYTSLVLFFGILLFVITISYLVFKTRKKANPLIEEEIENRRNYLNVAKVNIHSIQNYNNVNTQIDASSKSYPSSSQQFSNAQILPINYFSGAPINKKHINSGDHDHRLDNNSHKENRKKEVKTNYIRKPSLTNSRIEIMNDSKKFRANRNECNNEKSIRKSQSNLPEYNLLNFYSDNHENDFITATASQNSSV